MKIIISNVGSRFAPQIVGALFALGCASANPARHDSGPDSAEHNTDPTSADVAAPRGGSPRNTPTDQQGTISDEKTPTATDSAKSRVVGYLSTGGALDPANVDLDTLTHLNLAFAVPWGDGIESPIDFEAGKSAQVMNLVAAAHVKQVKVLGAIGGYQEGHRVADALKVDANAVVDSTVAFLDRYQLDGIDIDIEGPDIDPVTYEKYVVGLAERLPKGKLLTAAVGYENEGSYRSLDRVSFLNIMSYNQCGPWNMDMHCPHSTFEQASEDLEHWALARPQTGGRGLDRSNLVLGVPFYGWCLGANCAGVTTAADHSVTYAALWKFWNESTAGTGGPVPDTIKDDEHGYYVTANGPETIERKARLAKEYGGIMIWELGQDAGEPNSLFSVIKRAQ